MLRTKFDLLQVGARDQGQTLESGIFHHFPLISVKEALRYVPVLLELDENDCM